MCCANHSVPGKIEGWIVDGSGKDKCESHFVEVDVKEGSTEVTAKNEENDEDYMDEEVHERPRKRLRQGSRPH